MWKIFSKPVHVAAALSVALGALAPVFAQAQAPYPYPSDVPGGYPQQPYNQNGHPNYPSPPPYYDDRRAPAGYDGTQPPPPPPGYQPEQNAQQLRDQDRYYAEQTQRWAAENCVKSRGDGVGGALLGGLLGAVIGHSIGSRGDKGTATVAGAVIGGVGGAAISDSSGRQTSPGCPPGYVVRRGVSVYSYGPEYVYAAPAWYRPWVYYGNAWVYRPYPYRAYYYAHYRFVQRPGDWNGHREWHRHDEWPRDGR